MVRRSPFLQLTFSVRPELGADVGEALAAPVSRVCLIVTEAVAIDVARAAL